MSQGWAGRRPNMPPRVVSLIEELLLKRGMLSSAQLVQGMAAKGIYGVTRAKLDEFLAQHPHATRSRDGRWQLNPDRRRALRNATKRRAELQTPAASPSRQSSQHSAPSSGPVDPNSEQTLMDLVKGIFGSQDTMTTGEIRSELKRAGCTMELHEVRSAMFESVRVKAWGPDRWRWNDSGEDLYQAALARRSTTATSGAAAVANTVAPRTPVHARPTRDLSRAEQAEPSRPIPEPVDPGAIRGSSRADDQALLSHARQLVAPTAVDGMTCAFCLRPFVGGACRCDAA